jgi:hypothetical protein
MFQVVRDLQQECSCSLLLIQGLEASSVLLQGAKEYDIKHFEDLCRVMGKNPDFHSSIDEDRDNIIRHMKRIIVYQKYRFACFEFFGLPSLVQVWDKNTIDVLEEKLAVDVQLRSLPQ